MAFGDFLVKFASVVTGTSTPKETAELAIQVSETNFAKQMMIAVNAIKTATGQKITVTNRLSQDIYVLVSSNIDWQAAEIAATTVQIATGIGALKAIKSLALLKIQGNWKKFLDLLNLLKDIHSVGKTVYSEIEKNAQEIKDIVKKDGKRISLDKSELVHEKPGGIPGITSSRDVFSPTDLTRTLNDIGKIFSDSEVMEFKYMSIVIMNSDLSKIIAFHSNDNWSWIVKEDGVIREDPKQKGKERKDLGFVEWGENELDWSYTETLTSAVFYNPQKLASNATKMAQKYKK